MVSARATREMPRAPRTSSDRSSKPTDGIVKLRQALVERADDRDAAFRQRQRDAQDDRGHDGHEDGRHLGQEPAEDEHDGQAQQADGGRRQDDLAVDDSGDHPDDLADEPVGIDGEAEELGQLADEDGQGEAVHVAEDRGLGQQVGDEAEPARTRGDHHQAGEDGQRGCQDDRLGGVAVGADQREDRGRDHRAE